MRVSYLASSTCSAGGSVCERKFTRGGGKGPGVGDERDREEKGGVYTRYKRRSLGACAKVEPAAKKRGY